jgi:uncharacterized protein (TIGR03083 family)
MILSPRYDGAVILTIDGSPSDQLEPVVRQRRRLQALLATLDDDQWATPSRCQGWTVQDVVAHLAGVNAFWRGSMMAGLAGSPTRVLSGFDPAASPPLMVATMNALPPAAILEQFVTTNEGFVDAVIELTDDGWSTMAESPVGLVPIRLMAQHALWDSWVHERDIAIPLGVPATVEPDEVLSCLRYSAAVSPALALGLGVSCAGTFAVAASEPEASFVFDVRDAVVMHHGAANANTPCLRGSAVALVEALSLRAPLPASAPSEWRQLLGGLAAAFDADPSSW